MRIWFVFAWILIASLTPSLSLAETLTKDEIKALVLETIRENPEIVAEALTILQQQEDEARQAAALASLESMRDDLERDPNAPVLGNPEGDVTVVEFFDYNCPYCKRAADIVSVLLAEDDQVRLVYREWPILSEGSHFAARAALAAREQDQYEAMHHALMSAPRVDEAVVLQLARDLGLDMDRLSADMEAEEIDEHIDLSMKLTEALGFNGTPSFVIGNALVPGLVQIEQLRQLVADARNEPAASQ